MFSDPGAAPLLPIVSAKAIGCYGKVQPVENLLDTASTPNFFKVGTHTLFQFTLAEPEGCLDISLLRGTEGVWTIFVIITLKCQLGLRFKLMLTIFYVFSMRLFTV